jgi:lipoyl synthase
MSPDINEINVSIGTAAVLGLSEIKMDVAPTTAYLMLGGRCSMNCGFCAQARESHSSALNLSRVTWPAFRLDIVVRRLADAFAGNRLRRACLQVTVGPADFDQSLSVVRAIRAQSAIPIDVSILPNDLREVEALLDAGVDHIGFGLDAASRRAFEFAKTGHWERSLAMIEQTAERFPGRAAVHLIVGLGESEQEMVAMIQFMHDRGVTVGLFAFTPVRGTALAHHPPPALDQYRRMQVARYLISLGHLEAGQCAFDAAGRLIRIDAPDWRAHLADGRAFETSGCPDCNRPYYNERPGGVMYNYPRRLSEAEIAQSVQELGIE